MFKKLREWLDDNIVPLSLTTLIAVIVFYLLHKFYFY
jgi:hypothetical protein